MEKTIQGTVYNTQIDTRVASFYDHEFGDPCGYEETLFVTGTGKYYLYVNGGEKSPYPAEKIIRKSIDSANAWLQSKSFDIVLSKK